MTKKGKKKQESGSVSISGSVGPGTAVGHGAKVEASIIAGGNVTINPGLENLEPEARYLANLIYKLEGHDGSLEYIDLRGVATPNMKGAVTTERTTRKLLDPAFSVIEIPSSHKEMLSNPYELEKVSLNSIREAVEKFSCFTLIGVPGAGKTTTLRRLALDAALKRLDNPKAPIPLYKELPMWKDDQTLNMFISHDWNLDLDLEVALVKGDVALYLDGLNEMGASSKVKVVTLKEWLKGSNHPQQVIITCRAEDYGVLNLDITTVLVEALDEDKIRKFARSYLGDGEKGFIERVLPNDENGIRKLLGNEADKVIEDLGRVLPNNERKSVSERHLFHLARNPFMLRALTMIYATLPNVDLPSETGLVFKNLIKILWNREKDRNTSGWVPYDVMLDSLSKLAFNMMESKYATIVSLERATQYASSDILMVANSGNIVRLNDEQVSFYHQSMEEYFVANYIVANIENGALEKLMQHVVDSQWREVILLTASLLDNTDVFFSLFINKLNEIGNKSRLGKQLLSWAEAKANVNVVNHKIPLPYKTIALRAWYLFLFRINDNETPAQAYEWACKLAEGLKYSWRDVNWRPHFKDDFINFFDLINARIFDFDLTLDTVLSFKGVLATQAAIRSVAIGVEYTSYHMSLGHSIARAIFLSKRLGFIELHDELASLTMPDLGAFFFFNDEWQSFIQSLEDIIKRHRDLSGLKNVNEFSKANEEAIRAMDWSSKEDIGLYSDYLKATQLMIECLSILRVTDRTLIEDQLLLLPRES